MTDKVAIVVPVYKHDLSDSEIISLRHLTHHLQAFDKYFIVPEKLKLSYSGFKIKHFEDKYFENTRTYNKLLLSTRFYDFFENYQYILIYQLDCLVFSNELEYWCDQGYDYIGPPWIVTPDLPWVKGPFVGNGGFSLRNVESSLRVLKSRRLWQDPDEYWKRINLKYKGIRKYMRLPKKLKMQLNRFNNINLHIDDFLSRNQNEDIFFTIYAKHYYPDFTIAPIKQALRFGFEADPKLCFEMNDFKLPFGCHAWERYDRSFWEPYLLK